MATRWPTTVAERVRSWLDLFRTRGVAAVHEALRAAGLPGRVLSQPDGERLLTDLDHLGQLLHETARRQRLGLPALLEWFREERRDAARLAPSAPVVSTPTPRPCRSSPSTAARVCSTPSSTSRTSSTATRPTPPSSCSTTTRAPVASTSPARRMPTRRARAEDAGEELRLTYVALTRAQSQVVTWWGPSQNAANSGLSRLLFGRTPGESAVPDRVPVPTDFEAHRRADRVAGGRRAGTRGGRGRAGAGAAPRRRAGAARRTPFVRSIDTDWRRTSYSGLIRAEEQLVTAAVDAEPEVPGTVDEDQADEDLLPAAGIDESGPDGADVPSPMADLPAGATFGSLVHGVLEHADPEAGDVLAELRRRVEEQRRWWSVDATTEALAEALVPMQQHLARPAGQRPDPHRHRAARPARASWTSSSRSSAATVRRGQAAAGGAACHRRRAAQPPAGRRPDARVRRPARVAVARRPAAARLPQRVDRRGAAGARRRGRPPLRRRRLQDQPARRPGATADGLRLHPGADDRRDAARALPAAGTALLRRAAPLPALATARLRAGSAPRRHPLPLRPRHVRAETPEVDGQPCGVFAWHPPAAMVVELSDVLAGLASAAEVSA